MASHMLFTKTVGVMLTALQNTGTDMGGLGEAVNQQKELLGKDTQFAWLYLDNK